MNNKLINIFVEPTEQLVSELGNTYLQNYLASGDLSRGFAIVSDKRVYFKGSCYRRDFKKLHKTTEESIVDLNDITGTSYKSITPPFWMWIPRILTAALSIFSLLSVIFDTGWQGMESVICIIIPALIFTLCEYNYRKKFKNLFEISFAGGIICFDIKFYNKNEIDEFQRKIRIAKDNLIKAGPSVSDAINRVSDSESSMKEILDGLKKSSELLKEGVITQKEYDSIKVNLLKK